MPQFTRRQNEETREKAHRYARLVRTWRNGTLNGFQEYLRNEPDQADLHPTIHRVLECSSPGRAYGLIRIGARAVFAMATGGSGDARGILTAERADNLGIGPGQSNAQNAIPMHLYPNRFLRCIAVLMTSFDQPAVLPHEQSTPAGWPLQASEFGCAGESLLFAVARFNKMALHTIQQSAIAMIDEERPDWPMPPVTWSDIWDELPMRHPFFRVWGRLAVRDLRGLVDARFGDLASYIRAYDLMRFRLHDEYEQASQPNQTLDRFFPTQGPHEVTAAETTPPPSGWQRKAIEIALAIPTIDRLTSKEWAWELLQQHKHEVAASTIRKHVYPLLEPFGFMSAGKGGSGYWWRDEEARVCAQQHYNFALPAA